MIELTQSFMTLFLFNNTTETGYLNTFVRFDQRDRLWDCHLYVPRELAVLLHILL